MNSLKNTFFPIIFFFLLFGFLFLFKPAPVLSFHGCHGIFDCCDLWTVDAYGNPVSCISWAPSVSCSGATELSCTESNPQSYCISNYGTSFGMLNGCFWDVTGPTPTPFPTPTTPPPVCNCNWSFCFGPGVELCEGPGSGFCSGYCWVGEENFQLGGCTDGSLCNHPTLGKIPCGSCSFGYGNPYFEGDYFQYCIPSCGGPLPTPTSPPPPPPTCGDLTCGVGEDCNNCSGDCGACPLQPYCNITAYDVTLNGTGDIQTTFPITINDEQPSPYTVDSVFFRVINNTIAQFLNDPPLYPNPDPDPSYIGEVEGLAIGSTAYIATATMNDPGLSICSDVANLSVTNPGGWWQVKEGDAVTDGAISSIIPPTAPENYFIVHDALGEYPGVATYRGSVNPLPPNLSSTNWNADSAYSGTIPNYTFFEGRVSASSITDINNPVDTTVLTTGPLVNGYLWLKYDGAGYGNAPLVINDPSGTVNLGTNKVVLFVKDANLQIQSKINLTDGQGFFMAIVERNILVDLTVGGAHDSSPDLEGIYIADQSVQTGLGTQQLHVRGSVVGNTGVQLQRALTDNSLYPAELFEYAVDQMMLFPGDLTPNRLTWREVAP